MKFLVKAVTTAGILALAACNQSPTERAADNVEQAAENKADVLEERADNATTQGAEDRLEDRATQVRNNADNVTDAMRNGATPVTNAH
jgi:hypothetical protein